MARRIGTALAAGSIALASFLVAAPSAHAAALGAVSWNGTTLAGSSLSGAVSDTYTFTNTGGSTVYLVNDSGTAFVGAASCAVTAPATSLCSVTNGATVTVTVGSLGTIGVWDGVLRKGTITVTAGSAPPSGGGSSSASAPAPVVQQFARPTSGTCDAAQPAGLNWSGVAAGGWSESWAQWANGGQGGRVCTRTLEFANGWRVAS